MLRIAFQEKTDTSHALHISGVITDKTNGRERLLTCKKSERGAALIVFTLLITFVVLPLVGLGIDVVIQYWIKARLSSAVDSAALAAARSLNLGSTIDSQKANAQTVGRQYFAANFPTGVMGTTVFGGQQTANSVSIDVQASSNYITVTATAKVQAPLYFLSLLHLSSGVISASSQTTRRNANVMLVLDRSGSMNNAGSCAALVQDVQNFAGQFIDGRDRLGLVTFSTAAEVDYAPTLYFKSGSPTLSSVISQLVCVGATSSEQGLSLGYKQIVQTINQPGALNVIVFFTDGGANSVYADFPVKRSADTTNSRYDYQYTSNYNQYPASSCSALLTSLRGLYTDLSGSLNLTGITAGVIDVQPTGISAGSSNPPAISASGCKMASNSGNAYGWGPTNGRADVAYIPASDLDGNPTSGTGYKVPYTFTTGPYVGKIRADSPQAIRYAAINVADAMAQKIRSDAVYGTVTYTIGLAGNEAIPMDTDFMKRLANAQGASNFDSTQPVGQFILATDTASMADAFSAIASQILRLSR